MPRALGRWLVQVRISNPSNAIKHAAERFDTTIFFLLGRAAMGIQKLTETTDSSSTGNLVGGAIVFTPARFVRVGPACGDYEILGSRAPKAPTGSFVALTGG